MPLPLAPTSSAPSPLAQPSLSKRMEERQKAQWHWNHYWQEPLFQSPTRSPNTSRLASAASIKKLLKKRSQFLEEQRFLSQSNTWLFHHLQEHLLNNLLSHQIEPSTKKGSEQNNSLSPIDQEPSPFSLAFLGTSTLLQGPQLIDELLQSLEEKESPPLKIDLVDVSRPLLMRVRAWAEKRGWLATKKIEWRFVEEWVPQTRLPERSYQLLIASDLFASLPTPGQQLFSSECARLLVKGGHLWLCSLLDPASEQPAKRLLSFVAQDFELCSLHLATTPWSLASLRSRSRERLLELAAILPWTRNRVASLLHKTLEPHRADAFDPSRLDSKPCALSRLDLLELWSPQKSQKEKKENLTVQQREQKRANYFPLYSSLKSLHAPQQRPMHKEDHNEPQQLQELQERFFEQAQQLIEQKGQRYAALALRKRPLA